MSRNVHNESRTKYPRKLFAVGLAGLALIGGAGASFSAWQSDAQFHAGLSANSVALAGSIDGATWVSDGSLIEIDPAAVEALDQGSAQTVSVWLRNDGASAITLTGAALDTTGAAFSGGTPATATFVDGDLTGTALAPGETLEVVIEIATDAAWPDSYQAATGDLTARFDAAAAE